jgi:predicted CXXCH cytochrome family protein
MRILIHVISRGPGGASETQEKIHSGDTLTFGRATDQVLQCNDARVLLQHATVKISDERVTLTVNPPAQAAVNGRLCRDATLQIGDIVQLGPMLLRRLRTPAGYDAAFSLEPDPRAAVPVKEIAAPKLTLHALGWRKRPWAWAFFLACFGFGLLIPWMGLSGDGSMLQTLRGTPIPADGQWTSGALHPAHADLELECEACHAKPFQRVRNETCLDCHSTHLTQHVAAGHPQVDALLADRCTTCHIEHDEPSTLVQADTRLCTACHADPAASGFDESVLAVTDFVTQHPEFRVSLLQPSKKSASTADRGMTELAAPIIQRLRLDEPAVKERSNLEFPHKVHLDAKGIKAPQGEVVMNCADCHTPEAGGAGFQPITMEQHCADCHRLEFDPAQPERQLPHAEPAEAFRILLGHYSARYLQGYSDPLANVAANRQSPGERIAPRDRAVRLGEAYDRALLVATDIFERRVCADCHTVTRTDTAQGPVWEVMPVQLTQVFMPKARFDHASHQTADMPCSSCHAAESSEVATDVLMPKIESCRDCHGGEPGAAHTLNKVPGDCVSCHIFHEPVHPLWASPAVERALRRGVSNPLTLAEVETR